MKEEAGDANEVDEGPEKETYVRGCEPMLSTVLKTNSGPGQYF
jgi:hypothetical protein